MIICWNYKNENHSNVLKIVLSFSIFDKQFGRNALFTRSVRLISTISYPLKSMSFLRLFHSSAVALECKMKPILNWNKNVYFKYFKVVVVELGLDYNYLTWPKSNIIFTTIYYKKTTREGEYNESFKCNYEKSIDPCRGYICFIYWIWKFSWIAFYIFVF